jgi:hypothetical protein
VKRYHAGMKRVAALLSAFLVACVSHPNAYKPLDRFERDEADPRIRREAGAEEWARLLAPELDEAVRAVETGHLAPFPGPVRVFLCATDECFRFYVTTPGLTAAVVPDNRLILSPKLFGKESARRRGILVHELSHLHLGQHIGHYHFNTPIWFHEGLASLTADGYGADLATDAEAIAAIRSGQHFDPLARDKRDYRHHAQSFELSIHVFYRQAMLFVRFLRDSDEDAFRDFLRRLGENEDFDIAFGNAYNSPVKDLWPRFVEEINGGERPDTPEEG